ncbi:MAG: Asp-tRNA(Asn)/Glu-tRNA(Gln) amidotransferase subunit GatC [Pseudomonadota bacterium]
MQIDQATVKRIARLARIEISEAQAQSLEGELSNILDWVEQLDEVDTSEVEPMTQVVPMEMKKRADGVTDGEIPARIVANAPMTDDDFFVVPKIVE